MSLSTSVWAVAEAAVVAGDVATLERLLREHAALFQQQPPETSWLGGLAPDYSSADARTILTREHCFANFDELTRHLAALKQPDSAVARFESAVDSVVAGDAALLRQRLQLHPELAPARSPRTHHSTLLHYVGANGVEGWRQRTPANAVAIAELLLAAGATVDALADMYGGSTTLGLVATSIHPLRAGVQRELMETLLNHGAAIDYPGTAALSLWVVGEGAMARVLLTGAGLPGCTPIRSGEERPGLPCDEPRQDQEPNEVGQRHQSVHDIGKGPDGFQFLHCADKDGNHEGKSVWGYGRAAEQPVHISFAIIGPAQQGRKREANHAQRNHDAAPTAREAVFEGLPREQSPGFPGGPYAGHDDRQPGK
jgi:hypothetical protein